MRGVRQARAGVAVAAVAGAIMLAPAGVRALPGGTVSAAELTATDATVVADEGSAQTPAVGERHRSVTARFSRRRTEVGGTVIVTGRIRGSHGPQTVQLVQRLPSGPRVVATTTADGSYRMTVPTTWYDRQRLVVRLPETATEQEARSHPGTVTVVPDYRPAGSARSWTYIRPGERYRFDPCRVVTYRVNTAQASAGALRDVKGAFARIREATGMRFKYVGSTAAVPWSNVNALWQDDADIVIAWARQSQTQLDGSAGLGGPVTSHGARDAYGAVWETDTAGVTLDAGLPLTPGFGTSRNRWHGTRGGLLMHELAHALGAGHSSGRGQIMRAVMTNDPARYGAGDLAVLHRLGLASGCV